MWKDIPGYEGRYQINEDAEIRSLLHAKPKLMKTFANHHDGVSECIQLLKKDGKYKRERVSALMAACFMDGKKKGFVVEHIDGNGLNNALYNLRYTTHSELSGRIGEYNRKPVCKVNRNGEIEKVFKSIRDAARQEFICERTLSRHCNGHVKRKNSLGEYEYMFHEDYIMRMG